MRLLIAEASLLLVGLCLLGASQQPVSPVALSEAKDVVPAFDSSGAITLPAARLKVDVAYAHGKQDRNELTVVYDPKTGHYLWHVAAHNPSNSDDTGLYVAVIKKQRAVAFADSAALVDFIFGGTIFVKAWQGHADSLDAAVSASTKEMQQGLAVAEGSGYHMDYKFVPIAGPIVGFQAKIPPGGFKPFPPGFTCEVPPRSAFCPTDNNTIASVSRQGTNWRLVLRNRFDVEVILDQNFDLVSTQQLTQPKPEKVDPRGLFK
jgi:hypothetical protein